MAAAFALGAYACDNGTTPNALHTYDPDGGPLSTGFEDSSTPADGAASDAQAEGGGATDGGPKGDSGEGGVATDGGPSSDAADAAPVDASDGGG